MERQLHLSLIHQSILAEKAKLAQRLAEADEHSDYWFESAIAELNCAMRSLQHAAKCVGHVEGIA